MSISIFFSIITAVLLSCGLYILLSEKLQLPSLRSIVVLMNLTSGTRTSTGESLILQLSSKLQKLIHLAPYRRRHLEQKLSQANMNMSPELYVSSAIVLGIIACLPAIAFLFVFPLFSIPFSLLAVWIVFKQLNSINKHTSKHHDALENEYPRFAAAISESLLQKDVIRILKGYYPVAGKSMKKELDVLLADMETGDRELALSRFEYRLNSEHGTSIVNALIGLEKGENMQVYLSGLVQELRSWENSQLRLKAQKRPDELKPALYALLAAVGLLYAALFGTLIVSQVIQMANFS